MPLVIGGAAGATISAQDDQKANVHNHDDLMKTATAPAMPCHSANTYAFAALAMKCGYAYGYKAVCRLE